MNHSSCRIARVWALILIPMLLWVAAASAAGWAVETVDVGAVGKYDSLAIDSSGRPHISYYDDKNGNLKYATKITGAWMIEVVTVAGKPNGASNAVYTSIAVDGGGNPHIVFFDDNKNQLRYAVKSGTTWTIEVVDPGCGSTCALNGYFPALALDASGIPHVSYYGHPGGTANGYLKYAVKAGGTWTTEIVDTDGDAGNETSIAVDASGRPHIAYVRYPGLFSHGPNTLKYAVKLGRKWTTEVVDASGRMLFTSIVVDPSANPRISYHEWNNGALLFSAKNNGLWTKQTVDGPQNVNVGRYDSLVLDPKTQLGQVSYFDISDRVLKFAVSVGQSWVTQVADANGDVGRFSRLALDPAGVPHISYYNATTYSLMYASMLQIIPRVPVKIITLTPNDFPYTVTIETSCVESVAGVCLRQEIIRTCVGGNCFDVPPGTISPQCLVCALGLSGLIGLGLGALGARWFAGRGRP